MLNLSAFLTKENIIFLSISGLLALVVIAMCFIILRFFAKAFIMGVKRIFHKNNTGKDQGEDIDFVINEVEVSKAQRAKLEQQNLAVQNSPPYKEALVTPRKGSEENSKDRKIEKHDEKKYGEKKDDKKYGSEDPKNKEAPEPKHYEINGETSKTSKDNLEKPGYVVQSPGVRLDPLGVTTSAGKDDLKVVSHELTAQNSIVPEHSGSSQEIKMPHSSIKSEDSSIFGEGSEVSRIKLEHELRNDEKIWKAQKAAGLNISRAERAELVKDIPKVYGRNVSKADLKQTVKKLGLKMLSTTDSAAHAKLRKEIKFFKKIGGIK